MAKKKTTTAVPENSVGSTMTADEPSSKSKSAPKVRSKKKTKGSPRARRVTKKVAETDLVEIAGPETSPAPAPTATKTASPNKKRKMASGTKKSADKAGSKSTEKTTEVVASPVEEQVHPEAAPARAEASSEAPAVPAPVEERELHAVAEPDLPQIVEVSETAAGEDAFMPSAEIIESTAHEGPRTAQADIDEDEGDEDHQVVEMSTEEALAFLASLSGKAPEPETARIDEPVEEAELASFAPMPTIIPVTKTSHRMVPRRPFKGALDSNSRILTFESADVDAGMRVAGSTLARLYGLVRDEGFDTDLGPICQTLDEFISEWDKTPIGVHAVILANLSCASSFLDWIVAERPQVSEAFWIVYETLRGDVSSCKNVFLAELRTRNRARAIGFGPRNVIEAARRGAEAVRGHVEWGFGTSLAAACD